MSYALDVTLTNETTDVRFSEWREEIQPFDLDDGKPDFGAIYRACQSEFGRCQSSVYIDKKDGPPVRIGWFFVSRQQYEDTRDTYLRGAWVTVLEVPDPAPVPAATYVPLP
jgi:hypothetical protein